MPPVDPQTEPIRRAVASGEFRKAAALWEEHSRRLREEIRNGTFSGAKLAQARDLVDWCALVARCARSHAQGRLKRLDAAQRYEKPLPRMGFRISATG